MQVDPIREGVAVPRGRPAARVGWVLLWLALAAFAAEFVRHVYLKYAALESPAYAMFLTRRGWLWCHLGGGAVGIVLGFPALRVQAIYLAFATLGFNTAIWLVMRNEEWLTGGTFGINNIARPSLFGFSLDKNLPYYYFILGTTLVLGALLWKLLNSPWGKAFTALRDNPIRAESLGVNIQAYTLLSFAIGAAYAGAAGALFASLVQFIEPAPFTVGASIMMYLMVVVGGSGYFFGPLIGSAVGVLLPEWLRFAQGWYLFVFGSAVVLLMLWLPDGLLSIPDRIKAKRVAREASAARAAAAASVGAQP
jgi:branched-chain amino acid transport system permease protein